MPVLLVQPGIFCRGKENKTHRMTSYQPANGPRTTRTARFLRAATAASRAQPGLVHPIQRGGEELWFNDKPVPACTLPFSPARTNFTLRTPPKFGIYGCPCDRTDTVPARYFMKRR